MEKAIYRKQPFLSYKSMVMLYQSKEQRYLAHAFIYNGRDAKYLLFLYKDGLPKGGIIAGWNYLDDTSYKTVIVPEATMEQAIDDFLAVWKPNDIQKEIEIIEIEGFDEIDTYMEDKEIKKEEIVFFGRK